MELLFLFLLPLLYLLAKMMKSRSNFSPPGPLRLPFIGNLHQIYHTNIPTFLWQLSKSYGPIVSLNFGFIPTIAVSSASLAKEILKTQDIIFCNRPSFVVLKKFSYNGLDVTFSPYNKYWRDMKKIFMLHLLCSKRVESFSYIREEEVSSGMKKIHEMALSSMPVNLSELVKSVVSTILMRVGYGKRYQDEYERKKLLRLLTEIQVIFSDSYVSDIWRGLPFVGLVDRLLGKTGRLENCFQYFDAFYQNLIDEHLNSLNPKSREKEDDFIDILLRLKEDNLVNLTHDHIKALLMDVLVAGTDTSTAIVVWTMTTLIKNPKVMKKAQEEVRNAVGNKGRVDEDDLSKLTYLKAVVKEIMRLYPPAPLLIPRETAKDTILHGYKIKRQTLVFVNAFAIGRDPESWESPEEFLPERFLGSNIEFRGNDFELIPFGAGRRLCPGISMGVMIVDLLLANLLYLFNWGLSSGKNKEDIDVNVMPGVTLQKKNDLCLLARVYL